MKKRILIIALMLIVTISSVGLLTSVDAAINENVDYYRFANYFLLEPIVSENEKYWKEGVRKFAQQEIITVPELLDSETNPKNPNDEISQYILSTYDEKIDVDGEYDENDELLFAFLSSYWTDSTKSVPATYITSGYKSTSIDRPNYISPTIVGLTGLNSELSKKSGIRFQEQDGKVYLYYYTTSNNAFSNYLYINNGRLEFSHENKTLWSFEQEQDGSKNIKLSAKGYCLTVTEVGLDIIKEDDAPHGGYLSLHKLSKDAYSYIHFYTGDDYILRYSTNNEINITLPTNDVNDRAVTFWSSNKNVSSYLSYEEYTRQVRVNETQGEAPIYKAGSSNNFNIPDNKSLDLYSVYSGHIHYIVYTEDGEKVTGTDTLYCAPTGRSIEDFDLIRDFSDTQDIVHNCWVRFDMPKSGINGGYDFEVVDVSFRDSSTYSFIDRSIDASNLSIINDGQSVLLNSMPAKDDVYIKITVRKTIAEVPMYGPAYTYAGPGRYTSAESKPKDTEYLAYGTESIRLHAEYIDIVNFDNPDYTGEYSYCWYSVINGERTYLGYTTGDTFIYKLPDVENETQMEFYAQVLKTNNNTNARSIKNADKCTVTVRPFTVEFLDTCTDKNVFEDNIFISVAEGLYCRRIENGVGDFIPGSKSYVTDNTFGSESKTVEGVNGFNYLITENGEYSFRIEHITNGEVRGYKYVEITYDNIIKENGIKIVFHDIYTSACPSDRILVLAETYSTSKYWLSDFNWGQNSPSQI